MKVTQRCNSGKSLCTAKRVEANVTLTHRPNIHHITEPNAIWLWASCRVCEIGTQPHNITKWFKCSRSRFACVALRANTRVVNGLGLPRGWVRVGSGSHRPRVEVKLGLHGPCGGVRVGSHGLRVEVGLGLSKLTLD